MYDTEVHTRDQACVYTVTRKWTSPGWMSSPPRAVLWLAGKALMNLLAVPSDRAGALRFLTVPVTLKGSLVLHTSDWSNPRGFP